MYLFQSEAFGSILHTGDCRLTPDCVEGLCGELATLIGGTGGPA